MWFLSVHPVPPHLNVFSAPVDAVSMAHILSEISISISITNFFLVSSAIQWSIKKIFSLPRAFNTSPSSSSSFYPSFTNFSPLLKLSRLSPSLFPFSHHTPLFVSLPLALRLFLPPFLLCSFPISLLISFPFFLVCLGGSSENTLSLSWKKSVASLPQLSFDSK